MIKRQHFFLLDFRRYTTLVSIKKKIIIAIFIFIFHIHLYKRVSNNTKYGVGKFISTNIVVVL